MVLQAESGYQVCSKWQNGIKWLLPAVAQVVQKHASCSPNKLDSPWQGTPSYGAYSICQESAKWHLVEQKFYCLEMFRSEIRAQSKISSATDGTMPEWLLQGSGHVACGHGGALQVLLCLDRL